MAPVVIAGDEFDMLFESEAGDVGSAQMKSNPEAKVEIAMFSSGSTDILSFFVLYKMNSKW